MGWSSTTIMTTPDPNATLPGAPDVLGPASTQLPRVGETPVPPAMASNTPGVSLAGARVPGGPSLPDENTMLTQMLGQLANELFSAPPGASPAQPNLSSASQPSAMNAPSPAMPATGAAGPSPVVPSTPMSTTAPSAAPTAMPTAAPVSTVPGLAPGLGSDLRSPFDAPLDFGAIATTPDPFGGLGLSLGLLDSPAPAPAIASERGTPNLPAPIAPSPVPVITFDTFEIVPTSDPSIRSLGGGPFDANVIKREFPILNETVRGKRLVWLDNAATTQKPRSVIDRISYFYEHENSNIHRAAHTLAARATDAYEAARESVRRFIKAPSTKEIIFVRGTTEGINLIAQSWGRRNINAGDEIVISWLEHHANIVPWQMLCEERGARLRVAPVDDRGQVLLDQYEKLLGPKTKLVSFTQVSNALGTVTPAKDMIDMAHRHGAVVVLDGAQAVSHMPVDVQALGCDFFVFSGHKVFGPTGIGVVHGRTELLEAMPPWQGGGNMIQDVTLERSTFQPPPFRFEAGTGNIADAVGLGAALDWLSRVGVEQVGRYEHELLEYGTAKLCEVPGLTLIGTAPDKAGVMSFILDGQNTTDVGGMLDQEGIAVRSGHHCAQPILRRFGLEATVRASLAPYNTFEDLDALAAALHRLQAGRVSR